MENDEMMVFELLASLLIKELKEFINFNRNKQIITETTIKRRDFLQFLLNIKNKSELNKFDFNQTELASMKIEENFYKSIQDATLCLSKVVVRFVNASEVCFDYIKYLNNEQFYSDQHEKENLQEDTPELIEIDDCVEEIAPTQSPPVATTKVSVMQQQQQQSKSVPILSQPMREVKKYNSMDHFYHNSFIISNLPLDVTESELKSLSSDIKNVLSVKNKRNNYFYFASLEFQNEEIKTRNYKSLQSTKLRNNSILDIGCNHLKVQPISACPLLNNNNNCGGEDEYKKLHIFGIEVDTDESYIQKILCDYTDIKVRIFPLEPFASVVFTSTEEAKEALTFLKRSKQYKELTVGYGFMHLDLRRQNQINQAKNYNNQFDLQNFKRIHIFGIKENETVSGVKSLIHRAKYLNMEIFLNFNTPGQEFAIVDFETRSAAEVAIRHLNGQNYDGRTLIVDFCFRQEKLLEENRKLDNRYCLNVFGVNNREDLDKLLAKYRDFKIKFKSEFAVVYFSKRSDANLAIMNLHKTTWHGKKLTIDYSYNQAQLRQQFEDLNQQGLESLDKSNNVLKETKSKEEKETKSKRKKSKDHSILERTGVSKKKRAELDMKLKNEKRAKNN
jgi:RNA recognition motif-containing protein